MKMGVELVLQGTGTLSTPTLKEVRLHTSGVAWSHAHDVHFNANVGSLGRTKRVVKYRKGLDMWTYIAGQRRLPGACVRSGIHHQDAFI